MVKISNAREMGHSREYQITSRAFDDAAEYNRKVKLAFRTKKIPETQTGQEKILDVVALEPIFTKAVLELELNEQERVEYRDKILEIIL